MPWKPGESGNAAGRPVGSRNRLSEAFVADVLADWQAHGRDAIARCRAENPGAYCRVVASLVPRDHRVEAYGAAAGGFLAVLMETERLAREREERASSGASMPAQPAAH